MMNVFTCLRGSKMKELSHFDRLNVIAALSLIGGINYSIKPDKPPMKEEPCLNCGKIKQHNNSFCSAECCKGYKKR